MDNYVNLLIENEDKKGIKMKSKIKKATYQNPIVIMIVLFMIGIYGLGIPMGQGLWGMIAQRLLLGIMMFVALYLIAGKEAFQWTKKSGRYALLRGEYPLLVSLYFSVNSLMGGTWIIKNNILIIFIVYLLFSFSIGIFEEGLFRGIIMNGFVKIMPKTKAGLYWAVIISSFIFGFVHVMSYIPYIEINPLSIFVQMISKIINAGALGMLLATIYLKTKNIWTCVTIHALNDFFTFFREIFQKLGSVFTAPRYVDVSKIMNQQITLYYILFIMLSIPNIIIAVMILKKLKPQECIIWK